MLPQLTSIPTSEAVLKLSKAARTTCAARCGSAGSTKDGLAAPPLPTKPGLLWSDPDAVVFNLPSWLRHWWHCPRQL